MTTPKTLEERLEGLEKQVKDLESQVRHLINIQDRWKIFVPSSQCHSCNPEFKNTIMPVLRPQSLIEQCVECGSTRQFDFSQKEGLFTAQWYNAKGLPVGLPLQLDIEPTSWLDNHPTLKPEMVIPGRIIMHAGGEAWGKVAILTECGKFALSKPQQESALKNIGSRVNVKPIPEIYYTVSIVEYID
ncbi:MAG: hypothetical protein EP332_06440 [Bacteroidetes bacterium]|nr:MAG: hypothetical protein EP332_06440 [Bacteroidota bacterium]